MKKTHCLLIAALAATPLVAVAQDAGDNPRGPYIGVGGGQFNLDIDGLADLDDAAASVRDSDDNAWKLFVGYRFTRWLSLEAAYIDLGNPGDSFDASGSDGNYRVALSGFAPSLIGTVPVGPVELFG
jgi:OOP family OmpA-OmpF porin